MIRIQAIVWMTVLLSCAGAKKNASTNVDCKPIFANGKLFASLYQQRAPEYYALCMQAYHLAQLRFDQYNSRTLSRPAAIVTDIDETVLDNSPYAVHRALQGKDYEPTTWEQWTSMRKADTIPGALGFMKHVATHNAEVFYITNRNESERNSTLSNLQQFGFPFADSAHLLLRKTTSGKEARRQQVASTHEILLLLGDNLSDFSALYDKQASEIRQQVAKDQTSSFGDRFIVLPNPGYGEWEAALYQYDPKFNSAQKDSIILSKVKGY